MRLRLFREAASGILSGAGKESVSFEAEIEEHLASVGLLARQISAPRIRSVMVNCVKKASRDHLSFVPDARLVAISSEMEFEQTKSRMSMCGT